MPKLVLTYFDFDGSRGEVARLALRRILDWPSGKVLMAHGAPVERDGRAFIARAFGWLGV